MVVWEGLSEEVIMTWDLKIKKRNQSTEDRNGVPGRGFCKCKVPRWDYVLRRTWWRLNPSLQSLAPIFSSLADVSVLMCLVIMYFYVLFNVLKLDVVSEPRLWSQTLRSSNPYSVIDLLAVWPGTSYSTSLVVSFSFVKMHWQYLLPEVVLKSKCDCMESPWHSMHSINSRSCLSLYLDYESSQMK